MQQYETWPESHQAYLQVGNYFRRKWQMGESKGDAAKLRTRTGKQKCGENL